MKIEEASCAGVPRSLVMVVLAVAAMGCGKLAGPGIFSMGPQPPGGSAAEPEAPSCHLNPDGTETCGYDCKLSAGQGYACAATPDGTCAMQAGGEVVCTDPEPAPAPRTASTPAPAPSEPAAAEESSFSARCCVNGAFYDCPSREDLSVCIGEPSQLMSCVSGCGMTSSCDEKCIADHGPRPRDSGCRREPSRDPECRR